MTAPTTSPMRSASAPPVGQPWPTRLSPVFERFLTTEFATLNRSGTPITFPVTPYPGDDTLDVTTGLAYPSKAERARRDPRVALLFSKPTGSGLEHPDVVLVQGLATVRDADLQANLDRYLAVAFDKVPDVYAGASPAVLERLMDWYWPRIWVCVTPLRIAWWPGGDLGVAPQTWTAPPGTSAPPSDPAPHGPSPAAAWQPAPDVRTRLDQAMTLGRPVLTTTDVDGWPLPVRTAEVHRLGPTTVEMTVPVGVTVAEGPVCLTFHDHPERFVGQENAVFVGFGRPLADGRTVRVEVERALADASLPRRNRVSAVAHLLRTRRTMRPVAVAQAARRGQPLPKARIPRSTGRGSR